MRCFDGLIPSGGARVFATRGKGLCCRPSSQMAAKSPPLPEGHSDALDESVPVVSAEIETAGHSDVAAESVSVIQR